MHLEAVPTVRVCLVPIQLGVLCPLLVPSTAKHNTQTHFQSPNVQTTDQPASVCQV